MKQFLEKYFKNKDDIFYLFFLNRDGGKKSYQRYTSPNRKNFQLLLNESKEKNTTSFDIYFSLNSFGFKDRKIMRSKNYVKEIKAIYFDIDEDAINIKNYILSIKEFSSPTFIIQTSEEKYQLIYLLEKPLTSNFNEFEQILKFLTQYFKTDKTFDISRIFRVPNMVNNKNGFRVNYLYDDTTVDFEEIKTFAFLNGFKYEQDKPIIIKPKKEKQPPIQRQNPIKSLLLDIEQYKDTKHKKSLQYDYLLEKYHNDKSTADLAYCRWLVFKKNIKKDKTIIKKLIVVRGYENLITAHPYIDDYLITILEKCKRNL